MAMVPMVSALEQSVQIKMIQVDLKTYTKDFLGIVADVNARGLVWNPERAIFFDLCGFFPKYKLPAGL